MWTALKYPNFLPNFEFSDLFAPCEWDPWFTSETYPNLIIFCAICTCTLFNIKHNIHRTVVSNWNLWQFLFQQILMVPATPSQILYSKPSGVVRYSQQYDQSPEGELDGPCQGRGQKSKYQKKHIWWEMGWPSLPHGVRSNLREQNGWISGMEMVQSKFQKPLSPANIRYCWFQSDFLCVFFHAVPSLPSIRTPNCPSVLKRLPPANVKHQLREWSFQPALGWWPAALKRTVSRHQMWIEMK